MPSRTSAALPPGKDFYRGKRQLVDFAQFVERETMCCSSKIRALTIPVPVISSKYPWSAFTALYLLPFVGTALPSVMR